jgi:hypothetical protein
MDCVRGQGGEFFGRWLEGRRGFYQWLYSLVYAVI